MSKLNLFFVSLVAALPSGVLSYILASNFLFGADKMESMLQIVSGFTLLVSALVTFLPIGILIFGPKTEKPLEEIKKEMSSSASQAEVAVVEEPESEVLIPARDSGEFEVSDSELPAFDEGDDNLKTESDLPAFANDEDFQTEAEFDSVDFDEDFGDEEEKPKGRKR